LSGLDDERGEFTVVTLIGQSTDITGLKAPTEAELATEVGELTIKNAATKRKAINIVARKYGLAPNQVYNALEIVKKSVK
jgi:hypothetical protein